MEGYFGALELTVIALGALLLISFCFLLLTRILQWFARFGGPEDFAPVSPKTPGAQMPSIGLEEPAPSLRPIPRVVGPGVVTSPMPGTVISIAVSVGTQVKAGDVLLVVESMKILNDITAHCDGRVQEIHVAEGMNVRRKEPLITLEVSSA